MKVAILLTILALLGLCSAHLAVKGRYQPRRQSSPKVYNLPQFNHAELKAKEDDSHGGYQFAHVIDFPLTSEESGFWSILPSGDKVWTLTLRSEGALSLGVTFEGFNIPEGGELYLVGDKKVSGAFGAHNKAANGRFVSYPLEGSSLTFEYFHPAGAKQFPTLNIAKVAYGYKPLGYGDSGTCNNNAVCETAKWGDQIRSSGMLLSGFGSRFCSGGLVNNALNDGTQLFLTAYHCTADSADVVAFNYQSPTCTPNQDGDDSSQIGGLVSLSRDSRSDFHIFRIDEAIPASWNVYLSGISGENKAATSLTGIHHPSGDIKKISFAFKNAVPTKWSATEPANWHWEVPSWDDGTTEPGSSGSPLYDQNQRVVGQLHGGAASCRVIDYDSYGATWASWPLGLGKAIDPAGSGILVVNGTDLNAVRRF